MHRAHLDRNGGGWRAFCTDCAFTRMIVADDERHAYRRALLRAAFHVLRKGPMMETHTIGEGVLNWNRGERVVDRYGAVTLYPDTTHGSPVDYDVDGLEGRDGTLVAVVLETRRSPHIGDLFRGLGPGDAEVGDEIELGTGSLFVETATGGHACVGLKPDDGREVDWLDPEALYRAHYQTVRLEFRYEEEDG